MFSKPRTMSMRGNKFKFPSSVNFHSSYIGRRFCPLLICCTSVLSVKVWYSYGNRQFIIRYISDKRAFYPLHVRYSCGHYLASRLHIPIARTSSGRGDKFCHRITKFCIYLSGFFFGTYPFAGVIMPLKVIEIQE